MTNFANSYDLKDEAQAKEYLDRIAVEYRFQCYHENLPDGCHRLGDFLEAFRHDFDKARTVYATNCLKNDYGASCLKYGNYNLLGRAGTKSDDAAYDAFMHGCEKSNAQCCHSAALMHQTGRIGGAQDFARAAELMRRGCAGGNTPSCARLSTYYITGKPGLAKDMAKAFEFARLACDEAPRGGRGDVAACANLGRMYRLGEGTEKNAEMAEKYARKAREIHRSETEVERQLTFGE